MAEAPSFLDEATRAFVDILAAPTGLSWVETAAPALPVRQEVPRQVWPELERALERWPLPEGLDDSILLNRAQLADAFRVSENTITKWISDGLPVEVEGGNGVPYQFRLSHCYAWKMDRDDRARTDRARGDELARQAALAFLNPGEDEDRLERGMSPAEFRAWAEAEYHRNRVDEQRGDLVRVGKVREGLEDVFASVRTFVMNMPDWCEVEFGLGPEDVAKLQERCDATLLALREDIERKFRPAGSVVRIDGRQIAMDI